MGTSILFYIIGLGFGTSYSLLQVDCFDFVRTHWAKKVGRAFLGCGLAEWYVKDLQKLADYEKLFTVLEPPEPDGGGPYR